MTRLSLSLLSCALLGACSSQGEPWSAPGSPAVDTLLTRWGATLDTDSVLAEYPRPTLVRQNWLNLNGIWQMEPGLPNQPPPITRELTGEILVPFPVESALSGVGRHHDSLWYKRSFRLPADWHGKRIVLHFGAVDWEAEVWVNGHAFPVHRGGFDAFELDITSAIVPFEEQEILVRVHDPTDTGDQPRGKQVREPGGIWYTSVTGIWQTVWLEPQPVRGIASLSIEPDWKAGGVHVTAHGEDLLGSDVVEVEVLERGGLLAARRGAVGEAMFVSIPAPREWSPDDPFLYDLRVTRSAQGGVVREQVTSYFGLRSIELVVDEEGLARTYLNGEPMFQMGVLDQGWWPDGLYTAPSDEALRNDVATAKALGFNLVRKHVKVEPERWYTWCDRLGILVWQDMPSGNNSTPESRAQFEAELERLIEGRSHHPSIVQWVLFNEAWGQYDTGRLTAWIRELDPTRLVTCASGWTDEGVGDVLDIHHYPDPRMPAVSAQRAAVLGEYGGLALRVEGHSWRADAWGYRSTSDADDLAFGYESLARELADLRDRGLAAAVYTQLTDVETECNGLVTYDRALIKVQADRISRANRGDLPSIRTVLSTSEGVGIAWHYRTLPPDENWLAGHGQGDGVLATATDFWNEGLGGFGTEGTPGATLGTVWNDPQIWLRQEFRLTTVPPGELLVRLHHDEDVAVWVNGEQVFSAEGYTQGYRLVRTGLRAEDVLREGINQIAVHCIQTEGGQYVDVGLAVQED
ncbi:MAG: sugar-binding domain-containing protein [Planctomycetota bacterium]